MNVDSSVASTLIEKAFESVSSGNYEPKSPFRAEIKAIILGTHKTYKYILVTALLAKATNPSINPLALQAGSKLTGAYDARSLCHSVLVRFERKYLANSLGGSNEPFLNKPARFPELDRRNAVRRGRDQRVLDTLCEFLPKVRNRKLAVGCLKDSLYFAIKASEDLVAFASTVVAKSPNPSEINDFIRELVSVSHEGESLVLAVGGLFSLFSQICSGNMEIQVHPVNQSGASSKEISDIDVYHDGVLLYSVEVKDKEFSFDDVHHAIAKVREAHFNRLIFVKGPKARAIGVEESILEAYAKESGIFLTFFGIHGFAKTILALSGDADRKRFFEGMRENALKMKFKTLTIKYLERLRKLPL